MFEKMINFLKNLFKILKNLFKIFKNLFKENIEIEIEFKIDKITLNDIPEEYREKFLNLIKSAYILYLSKIPKTTNKEEEHDLVVSAKTLAELYAELFAYHKNIKDKEKDNEYILNNLYNK